MVTTQQQIEELLRTIENPNITIEYIITTLSASSFYTATHTPPFNYRGGLADHSLAVTKHLLTKDHVVSKYGRDNVLFAGLLHNICVSNHPDWNRIGMRGGKRMHGIRSIEILNNYFHLDLAPDVSEAIVSHRHPARKDAAGHYINTLWQALYNSDHTIEDEVRRAAVRGILTPRQEETDDETELKQMESMTVEKKSSFLYSQGGKQDIDEQMRELMQAIAAFMNADGGHLYIGVRDDGTIRGIDQDLPFIEKSEFDHNKYAHTPDGFKQKLYSCIRHHLGGALAETLVPRIEFKTKNEGGEELTYVKVHVLSAKPQIIYYDPRRKDNKGKNLHLPKEIYVRADGKVSPLKIEDIADFVLRRGK